jgi:putative transposase
LILTAGQTHEVTQATRLIENLPLVSVIADKAYDTDAFRTYLIETEADAVIPPSARRIPEIFYDEEAYKLRYRVECFINKVKHYRRIATRYDKTVLSFFSMICLAAAMILMR